MRGVIYVAVLVAGTAFAVESQAAAPKLTEQQKMVIFDARITAESKTEEAKLTMDCWLVGCKPKEKYSTQAAAAENVAAQTATLNAFKKAIAACEGRPALIAALKEAFTKANQYIDHIAPRDGEGKATWEKRLSSVHTQLDDALARVQTEADLAE